MRAGESGCVRGVLLAVGEGLRGSHEALQRPVQPFGHGEKGCGAVALPARPGRRLAAVRREVSDRRFCHHGRARPNIFRYGNVTVSPMR
jgi:hypothetical protein